MLNIYLCRHGKTMFNTIGRAQGWSDTPLTKAGREGIHELGRGFAAKGLKFDRAYSSDTGRTLQTMQIILSETGCEGIPWSFDWRIREWCYGSFDGAYDGELFDGVLPRIFAENGVDGKLRTTKEMCEAIYEVDTAGWAETWDELSGRILTGFQDIAAESEAAEAENIVIASHGMTIGTFVELIQPDKPRPSGLLDNGSVTKLTYESGSFTVEAIGDMTYRQLGKK
ncbi:MAG: phosphoglycerate mutase family protein [Streptococcaceae bacterium]|jgi:probable phosphoglycerate mutase|nr:phosphoglycerate mutase family protein [Streptococcaceae bacterium]